MGDKEKSSSFANKFTGSNTESRFKRAERYTRAYFSRVDQFLRATDREDKYGHYDYIAVLTKNRFGSPAQIRIDEKIREKGAIKYWKTKNDPELALEIWSVKPYPGEPNGKAGWTLRTDSLADYILFTFDDTDQFFFLPFQLLRDVTCANYTRWRDQYGEKTNRKEDEAWESTAIYIPASAVIAAIAQKMRGVA